MTQDELQEAVRKRPFDPFRLVLTARTTYDVNHPELIMVGRRSAIIGISNEPNGTAYGRTIKVDLLHIVAMEELPVEPPANGSSS